MRTSYMDYYLFVRAFILVFRFDELSEVLALHDSFMEKLFSRVGAHDCQPMMK